MHWIRSFIQRLSSEVLCRSTVVGDPHRSQKFAIIVVISPSGLFDLSNIGIISRGKCLLPWQIDWSQSVIFPILLFTQVGLSPVDLGSKHKLFVPVAAARRRGWWPLVLSSKSIRIVHFRFWLSGSLRMLFRVC